MDLEALAAFDKPLASRAMAMMFSGGQREEALRWAGRLDPLQEADHAPFGRRLLGYAGSCSMAEWALATGDLEGLKIICEKAPSAQRLFENKAERVAGYCAEAMRSGLCEMADFLLERLSPITPKEAPRYVAPGWDELLKESAKALRADWLARVLELREAAGSPLKRGWDLARERFVTPPSGKAESWFEPGIEALRRAGAFEWRELPQLARAYAEASPPDWASAQRTLEQAVQEIRKREGEMSGWGRFDPKAEIAALFYWDGAHPRETPVEWVKIVMGMGVAPFYQEGDNDGREPPGLALLSQSRSSRDRYIADPAEREAARQAQDEKTKALLLAMIESGASGLEHHYAMSDERLKGARKISLLTLAALKGYWGCAEELAERGLDQKMAARQISAHMADGVDKAKAEAFFEALALKKISAKGLASKERQRARAGGEPAEPARPMRL